jgi:hypothetical protein
MVTEDNVMTQDGTVHYPLFRKVHVPVRDQRRQFVLCNGFRSVELLLDVTPTREDVTCLMCLSPESSELRAWMDAKYGVVPGGGETVSSGRTEPISSGRTGPTTRSPAKRRRGARPGRAR